MSAAWIISQFKPPPVFFPSRELQRCTIWFQAPAQLLLKTVGKHQGIRRICRSNSCLVMSELLLCPDSLSFFFWKPFSHRLEVSWARRVFYCSVYASKKEAKLNVNSNSYKLIWKAWQQVLTRLEFLDTGASMIYGFCSDILINSVL